MRPIVIMFPVDGGPDGFHTQEAAERWLAARLGPQLNGWDCWEHDRKDNMMVFAIYDAVSEGFLTHFHNEFPNTYTMSTRERYQEKLGKCTHFHIESLQVVKDQGVISWLEAQGQRNYDWWTMPFKAPGSSGLQVSILDIELACMFKVTFSEHLTELLDWIPAQ